MVGESARWILRLLRIAAGGCHQEVKIGAKRDYSIMYIDNYSNETFGCPVFKSFENNIHIFNKTASMLCVM